MNSWERFWHEIARWIDLHLAHHKRKHKHIATRLNSYVRPVDKFRRKEVTQWN